MTYSSTTTQPVVVAEYSRLKSHYESLGFTVTGSTSTSVSSSDVSGQDLVIDIAGTSNCGSTCRSVYDSYVSGGGKLIIAAPQGASNRQSNIESLIENKMSVGTMTYLSSTCSTDLCWYSVSVGDYATATQTTLPGAGQLFQATGGTAMASNTSGSSWHSWYKWDYGSNGGTIIVAMGYDQFQTNLYYTSNMTTFLTTVAEEEGLYSSTTTPTYSSAPTSEQLNKRTNTRNITNSGNDIYIQQSGNNVTINVRQQGNDNMVAGVDTTSQTTTAAQVDGNYNTVDIDQMSDDNILLFGINGDHNTMNVSQGDYLNDTGGHRAIVDITGSYNETSLTQYNVGFGSGQFADINVNGDDNTISSYQRETDKMLFIDIDGDDNSVTTNQKDSGEHFLDITLGSNQTVGITQEGTGDHAATIDMSGYSSELQLNQDSSTDQVYSLTQICTDAIGCGTTTITQQ